jgi:hypothetical protein
MRTSTPGCDVAVKVCGLVWWDVQMRQQRRKGLRVSSHVVLTGSEVTQRLQMRHSTCTHGREGALRAKCLHA